MTIKKVKSLLYTNYFRPMLYQILHMHVIHGPQRKGITVDWQYFKERYLETFLDQYTIHTTIQS